MTRTYSLIQLYKLISHSDGADTAFICKNSASLHTQKCAPNVLLYWDNKAIHDPDRSQLLLDLIIKVVTVAEAAPAASTLQKGVCFM